MPISHQKVPSGGWKYYEKRTNITLMAITWENLADILGKHRKSNGIPEGDPGVDIDAQIEEEQPELAI